MLRPIGTKHSPNYTEMLLINWTRVTGVNATFDRTRAGHHLGVVADKHPKCQAIVVESRACETARPRVSRYPFVTGNRASRSAAVRCALDDLEFRHNEDTQKVRELLKAESKRIARCGIELLST